MLSLERSGHGRGVPGRGAGPRWTLPTSDNPYLEAPARIMRYSNLVADVRLYDVRFVEPDLATRFDFRPGQFVMLSVLGVGEAPFSLPWSPTRKGIFQLGIRRAGVLTDYLFDHVREAMASYREEIFGPVLQMVRAESFEDALALPSRHQYGNGVAIFTRNGEAAREFADQVEVGIRRFTV